MEPDGGWVHIGESNTGTLTQRFWNQNTKSSGPRGPPGACHFFFLVLYIPLFTVLLFCFSIFFLLF